MFILYNVCTQGNTYKRRLYDMSKYFNEKPKIKEPKSFRLNETSIFILNRVSKEQKKTKTEIVEAAINFLYNSMIKDGEIK